MCVVTLYIYLLKKINETVELKEMMLNKEKSQNGNLLCVMYTIFYKQWVHQICQGS